MQISLFEYSKHIYPLPAYLNYNYNPFFAASWVLTVIDHTPLTGALQCQTRNVASY